MNLSTVLKRRREALGLTLDQIAQKMGVSEATVQRWESGGIKTLKYERITKLAQILGVQPSELMGWTGDPVEVYGLGECIRIPILGSVRAGLPSVAIENVLGYEEIPRPLLDSGDVFCLRIKGNSMSPRMKEGDTVIVRKQDTVENGDIAVVMINGDEATVKKFYRRENGISLIALNPDFEPLTYTPEEVDRLPVRVLGKVVELRARFD